MAADPTRAGRLPGLPPRTGMESCFLGLPNEAHHGTGPVSWPDPAAALSQQSPESGRLEGSTFPRGSENRLETQELMLSGVCVNW